MMRSRSRQSAPLKIIMAIIALMIILSMIMGIYLVPRNITGGHPATSTTSAGPTPPARDTSLDLGVTYLPLTPGVSSYYDLGSDAGALITEVAPRSLAERAGLRVGDVILSYNGMVVEKGKSLLSAVKDCPVGADIVMDVCRDKATQTFQFQHTSK